MQELPPDVYCKTINPLSPSIMKIIPKSQKLSGVCYDIRGPVLAEANRMEEEGQSILKLNIGNLAPFDFSAPDEMITDVILNIRKAQGYTHSKGTFPARKAIMQECQRLCIPNIELDDIFLGNGVSELIVMANQALLNDGDEVLVPTPDYPLWTAAVRLSGGTPIHYICDESKGWEPDLADMEAKITAKTRALVIINPNNPTGAVYSEETLLEIIALARKHQLVLFADEIYSKMLFDDAKHIPAAKLAQDIVCVSFNGLSKAYRLAGFRSGWMIVSGDKDRAKEYISGLEMLSSMRLCANVPAMLAIQTALGGYQSIQELITPGGRLYEQREAAYHALTAIDGVSCVKPSGAIYLFPKVDKAMYRFDDDEKLALDFLRQQKVLIVQGTAFNLPTKDHFRLVFLPRVDQVIPAIEKFGAFLQQLRR